MSVAQKIRSASRNSSSAGLTKAHVTTLTPWADQGAFPLHLKLTGVACLVIGAGDPAAAKFALLQAAGARVLWSPQVPTADAFIGNRLVVIATGDVELDSRAAGLARLAGALVNVVDRPALSDFIMPAQVRRGPVVISISSAGTAPVLAKQLRGWLEALLPHALGPLAAFLGRQRNTVRERLPDGQSRRRFWDVIVARFLAGLSQDQEPVRRQAEFDATLNNFAAGATSPGRHQGRIDRITVGPEPGAADLISLRDLRLLQQADAVVHDLPVDAEVLSFARREATLYPLEKSIDGGAAPSSGIEQMLGELVRRGDRVIHLRKVAAVFGQRQEQPAPNLITAGASNG